MTGEFHGLGKIGTAVSADEAGYRRHAAGYTPSVNPRPDALLQRKPASDRPDTRPAAGGGSVAETFRRIVHLSQRRGRLPGDCAHHQQLALHSPDGAAGVPETACGTAQSADSAVHPFVPRLVPIDPAAGALQGDSDFAAEPADRGRHRSDSELPDSDSDHQPPVRRAESPLRFALLFRRRDAGRRISDPPRAQEARTALFTAA